MAKTINVLFLLFIFVLIPQYINSLNITINLSEKSRAKSIGQSCIKNSDCGYGLSCIYCKCSCLPDEIWNGTSCVWKVISYFTTPSSYTISEITKYNGVGFIRANDIKVIEQPTYYIYVSSEISGVVAQYDQSGNYIKHVSVPGAIGIETVNNTNVYATSFISRNLYKFDSNLNLINTVTGSSYVASPQFIGYNPSNGYLYISDVGTNYVNVFDLSYNRIASESRPLGIQRPYGIGFYHSEILGDLIFVTTLSNRIIILKQSDKTVYKILSSVCRSGFIPEILIHQKSNHFLVSCYNNNIVQLWFINGTNFVYTGQTISISTPNKMTVDSNGRLMIAKFVSRSFSILTPTI